MVFRSDIQCAFPQDPFDFEYLSFKSRVIFDRYDKIRSLNYTQQENVRIIQRTELTTKRTVQMPLYLASAHTGMCILRVHNGAKRLPGTSTKCKRTITKTTSARSRSSHHPHSIRWQRWQRHTIVSCATIDVNRVDRIKLIMKLPIA